MQYYEEISSIKQQIQFGDRFVFGDNYENIVICGMGGSAIAGMIFADIFRKVPVHVVRDYKIPDYVGERTLFFAVSHSGNTEETLECLEQAESRNARIHILTSGGKISEFPGEKIIIPGDLQPRSSLGYMLMPFLNSFNLLEGSVLEKTAASIDKIFAIEDSIKEIADEIASNHKIPVIYGVPPSPTLAYRWKTQFNENSKIIAHSSTIPEMNHNELAAIPHDFDKERFEYFVAGNPCGRYLERLKITEEITGLEFHRPPELDAGIIPEIFSSVVYGDLVSYYVAESRGIDPRDVSAISALKDSLAEL